MDEILVSLNSVSRFYADGRHQRAALTDISCQVMASDRVAVVGPSGSGKSTLLHLMAGLDKPTRGVVSWPALGSETDLRPDQICVVFQTPSLLPKSLLGFISVASLVPVRTLLSTYGTELARRSTGY